MDVAALQRLPAGQASAVPLVMLTVTNNFGDGPPLSLANIQVVREVCDRYSAGCVLRDQCRRTDPESSVFCSRPLRPFGRARRSGWPSRRKSRSSEWNTDGL